MKLQWRYYMADICMCHNSEACKRAPTCYRALATPSYYQSVADFYKEDEECEYYLEVLDDNS